MRGITCCARNSNAAGSRQQDFADIRDAAGDLIIGNTRASSARGGLLLEDDWPRSTDGERALMQLRRHPLDRKNVVDDAGFDGARRHGPMPGGLRGLGERQPAILFDRSQSVRAVGA
jgi:hypothetical protein